MHAVFRADASVNIGTGHVMRCLAIAAALRKEGIATTFLSKPDEGDLCALIEAQGHAVIRLPACSMVAQADALHTKAALSSHPPVDWLIVDHYGLDAQWESALRPITKKLLAIDDLADRSHDCTLLLDQNYCAGMDERYEGLVPAECKLMLGPGYSLLRPDFAAMRAAHVPRLGKLDRILVFYGGSDPMNETAKALQGIRLAKMSAHVDVVVGSSNPQREKIRALCETSEQFHFHCQVSNMAQLMASADLALGAGGITTWERCCLGLPALVTVLADNQAALTRAVAEYGAIISLSRADALVADDYRQALQALTAEQLALMERRGLELVDGNGTNRVVDTLIRLAL